jgi:flagellar motor switch protein FliN
MAEEKPISQEEIEKLLSQAPSGTAAAAESQSAKSAPAASPGDAQTDKATAQDDIDKLLSQAAGKSPPPAKPKETSAESLAGEGSMAEKDIEFLLNQAEQALESIGSAVHNDLPQGVSEFRLQEFGRAAPASTDSATLDLVRDVELNLKIELGRTHMYLEDVLKLRKGSVVPLDKLAGDPVDVFVNGRLVAKGEVLVLNDNFCVRVAELVAGANGFNG